MPRKWLVMTTKPIFFTVTIHDASLRSIKELISHFRLKVNSLSAISSGLEENSEIIYFLMLIKEREYGTNKSQDFHVIHSSE